MNVKQKNIKIGLIISNVIFVLLGALSIMPIMFSPMMFDAPGSGTNPGILLLFFSLVSFPVIVILSIVAAWSLFKKKSFKNSLLISLLPIINILLMLVGGYTW